MVRSTLIDLNHTDHKWIIPFMISLDKCSGRCNGLISKNMCSEKNYVNAENVINVKVFHMTKNKIEVKSGSKHVPCD